MAILKAAKSDWVRLLGTAGAFVKEAKISVENGKASCLAIDPAKVVIVKASIDCEGDCPPFTVNVDQTLKALTAAGDEPIFEFDDFMSVLTVKGRAKVKVPLLADLGEMKDINRAIFSEDPQGVAVFVPGDVEPLVSYGIYNKEDTVTFDIQEDELKVTVGTGAKAAETVFKGAEGTAKSIYPLDYFDSVIKQCKGANDIRVILPNNNYPISLSWDIGNGCYDIVIAPRVEDE